MKVSTELKAGGYLETAAQEAVKGWGQVTNFVAEAEAELKIVTSDAINTTTTLTIWLVDMENKF